MSKSMRVKGFDVKLDIDLSHLVKGLGKKHKDEVKRLNEVIDKRDQYIHDMHQKLKSKEIAIFAFVDSVNIYRKALKVYGLSPRQYMMAMCLYECNVAAFKSVVRYTESIGLGKFKPAEIRQLVTEGIAIELDYMYFGITDKGKNMIDSIYAALKQDFSYIMKNKAKTIRLEQPRERPKRITHTEESKARQATFYRMMMRPFWDIGHTKMPKDRTLRVSYVINWIEERKKNNLYVDDMYYRLIEKWSAPIH